jgi:GT2 family glycosyltransferase
MARAVAQSARRMALDRFRYARFVARVEPALLAQPRVHRFALPPAIGAVDTRVEPLAVCIDPDDGGDSAATLASVSRQTVAPAALVKAPLEEALTELRAEWVLRVAAGDRLAPVALERLGQAVALSQDASIITADDDLAGARGRRHTPSMRPGPSPDLWAALDPGFALVALRRTAAARAVADGATTPYRLLVEVGGLDGAGQAHVPLVLCHRREPARREAATGRSSRAPAAEPAVEAIVSFRDRPELLERCARSLLEQSTYERLSLRLVDNASRDPRTHELVRRLSRDARVSAESDPRPFNFSALGNGAARRSPADLLVFLNNDTEIIQPSWVEALLPEALRPEVGAVAPLLVYPDGGVQHAGVAVGLQGWAGHPFAGLRPDTMTPFGTAQDGPRNWLAVSAACLMIERRKFHEVGGFDERFQVGGGDVDLGLRLTLAGYRSLCVPSVRVVHDEWGTRDPSSIPPGDFEASRRSYGAFRTVGDPFYHPALTLRDTSCRVRTGLDEGVPR